MIDKKLHGDVVELTLDNPPVNALGVELRRVLMATIVSADADPDIKAVVIRGAGKMFSAGADISEFGKPPVSPWLPDVVARMPGRGRHVRRPPYLKSQDRTERL